MTFSSRILNPYAAGGYSSNNKMMQNPEKLLKTGQIGTHLRVLSIFASLCFGLNQPQHWKGWVNLSWQADKHLFQCLDNTGDLVKMPLSCLAMVAIRRYLNDGYLFSATAVFDRVVEYCFYF